MNNDHSAIFGTQSYEYIILMSLSDKPFVKSKQTGSQISEKAAPGPYIFLRTGSRFPGPGAISKIDENLYSFELFVYRYLLFIDLHTGTVV